MTLQESNHNFSLNKIIITKRAEIYEKIGKKLNNIYCYIEEVGEYKDMTPETILKDRRDLNSKMHSHRAFWSQNTYRVFAFRSQQNEISNIFAKKLDSASFFVTRILESCTSISCMYHFILKEISCFRLLNHNKNSTAAAYTEVC